MPLQLQCTGRDSTWMSLDELWDHLMAAWDWIWRAILLPTSRICTEQRTLDSFTTSGHHRTAGPFVTSCLTHSGPKCRGSLQSSDGGMMLDCTKADGRRTVASYLSNAKEQLKPSKDEEEEVEAEMLLKETPESIRSVVALAFLFRQPHLP
jgi:hypothetical protein